MDRVDGPVCAFPIPLAAVESSLVRRNCERYDVLPIPVSSIDHGSRMEPEGVGVCNRVRMKVMFGAGSGLRVPGRKAYPLIAKVGARCHLKCIP